MVEQKAILEGIQVIEPYSTKKKADLSKMGMTVVAGGVLGFLVVRAFKTKGWESASPPPPPRNPRS